MKNIRITTLANGLRVASDRIDSIETVSLGMWVATGARHETEDVNGIAHLLEHMFFKGTTRRDAFAITGEIEAVGGHINAYTARETTAFHAKMLKEHVPLAVDILADILQHSVFDEDELSREREVVLQEIAQARDTPDDIIFDQFQACAFPGQPLGRPVLGEAKIVGALSPATLRRHRDRQYRTSDMVFAAAGKVEHEALVELAEAHFSDLAPGRATAVEPAVYRGGETSETRDLEQLHLLIGFQGLSVKDPQFYCLALLSNLLGGGMSSRLFHEIREKRALAYSIYSYATSFRDSGLFCVYAGTGPERAAELLPAIAEELTGLADTLRAEEIESSRAQLKASLLMGLESSGARCEQLAQQLIIFGRPLTIEETVAHIDAVDADQIAALARRIFAGGGEAPITLATLGPQADIESYDRFVARFAS